MQIHCPGGSQYWLVTCLSLTRISYHTPHSKSPILLFLKHHRNIPVLEVCSVSSLSLELFCLAPLLPSNLCSNVMFSYSSFLTIWFKSLLSCIILFYATYCHLRDITDLFTLCYLSLKFVYFEPQNSRDFFCLLLFPRIWYSARHNRYPIKLNGYLTPARMAIIKKSTNNECRLDGLDRWLDRWIDDR